MQVADCTTCKVIWIGACDCFGGQPEWMLETSQKAATVIRQEVLARTEVEVMEREESGRTQKTFKEPWQ